MSIEIEKNHYSDSAEYNYQILRATPSVEYPDGSGMTYGEVIEFYEKVCLYYANQYRRILIEELEQDDEYLTRKVKSLCFWCV